MDLFENLYNEVLAIADRQATHEAPLKQIEKSIDASQADSNVKENSTSKRSDSDAPHSAEREFFQTFLSAQNAIIQAFESKFVEEELPGVDDKKQFVDFHGALQLQCSSLDVLESSLAAKDVYIASLESQLKAAKSAVGEAAKSKGDFEAARRAQNKTLEENKEIMRKHIQSLENQLATSQKDLREARRLSAEMEVAFEAEKKETMDVERLLDATRGLLKGAERRALLTKEDLVKACVEKDTIARELAFSKDTLSKVNIALERAEETLWEMVLLQERANAESKKCEILTNQAAERAQELRATKEQLKNKSLELREVNGRLFVAEYTVRVLKSELGFEREVKSVAEQKLKIACERAMRLREDMDRMQAENKQRISNLQRKLDIWKLRAGPVEEKEQSEGGKRRRIGACCGDNGEQQAAPAGMKPTRMFKAKRGINIAQLASPKT